MTPLCSLTDKTLFPDDACAAAQHFLDTCEPARVLRNYRTLAEQVAPVRNIFFGDSITAAWPLHEFFPCASLLNRGIGGDSAVGLALRLRTDVLAYRPARVFMLIGINGIEQPEDLTFARICAVADAIREHGAHVFIGTVCPLRNPDKWNRFRFMDRIRSLNERLKDRAAQTGDGFLDYHRVLRDTDGQLRSDFAQPDGTHLQFPAYAAMARLVAPFLA